MITVLQILCIALIGLNLFWLNSIMLGIAATMGLIFILSRRSQDSLYTIIACISWVSLSGAFFYYTYKLTNLTIFISIALLPVIIHFLPKRTAPKQKNGHWLSVMAAVLSFVTVITVLWTGRTGEAIISPWPQVNSLFFIALFVLLVINFLRPSNVVSALVFVTASCVALVIYKNGFGFDPFIHQAAENYIKLHGTITPKTFYYIGHYALVIAASQIMTTPIEIVDSFLVPVLSGILISTAAYRQLGKFAALFLILPISFFAVTTPFSFALALFVILIFLQLEKAPQLLQWLLTACIFSIHPIVGVPALISTLFFNHNLQSKNCKLIIAIVGTLVLPALFLMVGKFTPHWLSINLPVLFDKRYNFWLELINIFELLILPTIIISGLIITLQKFRNHFWTFLIIATSGLLIKTLITFPDLIVYEQNNFADRILWLSVFILFIPLLVWLKEKISKLSFSSRLTKGLFFATISVLIIFGTYLSYPRRDVYAVSKGWSISDADKKTVNLIEQDAHQAPYIVLANQATAAAALETFGFRYLKSSGDEFFFYPIPTSGQLYQYYLEIVYENQGRDALFKAMEYANVTTGYFAISNYWWDAENLKNSAKLWADQWFDVDEGKITVFKLKRK